MDKSLLDFKLEWVKSSRIAPSHYYRISYAGCNRHGLHMDAVSVQSDAIGVKGHPIGDSTFVRTHLYFGGRKDDSPYHLIQGLNIDGMSSDEVASHPKVKEAIIEELIKLMI